MDKIKRIIKKVIPPIFLDVVNKFKAKSAQEDLVLWTGPYPTWEEVALLTGGYNQSEILESCRRSLLKVKNGDAVYERDSVLFDEIQYSWPVLASLLRVASENEGKLRVLDFGGSLGSSYFQNKGFLQATDITWCIVEQEHFVGCGRENFENSELKFYDSIDHCLDENSIDVLLLSSVIQYLDDPFQFLHGILKHRFKYILFDRTCFTDLSESKIMLQKVPKVIYEASYPCWFISEPKFLDLMKDTYSLIAEFESVCDGPSQVINEMKATWKGFLYQTEY